MTLEAKERFSLLHLEEGEFYISDYSSEYLPPAETERETVALYVCRIDFRFNKLTVCSRQHGRLKLCSKSILFDPEDIAQPLLRIPLRDVDRLGVFERGSLLDRVESREMFIIGAKQVIKMKAGNRDQPYVFEKVQRFS